MCIRVFVCPAGYYTHVSTLADVQENVMEYLHVLSRPMVINHDHDIIWTEAYMDSVVSLRLSLSVCLLGNAHTLILHQRYLADIMKMSDSFRTLAILLLVHLIHYTVVFYGGQQRQTVSLCLFVKTCQAGPFISAPLSMVLNHLKSLHPIYPGNHTEHHSIIVTFGSR